MPHTRAVGKYEERVHNMHDESVFIFVHRPIGSKLEHFTESELDFFFVRG